jgi:hypothetical protein
VARADELATTVAERACLAALRDATGGVDNPMRIFKPPAEQTRP